jgi:hypothetical protein
VSLDAETKLWIEVYAAEMGARSIHYSDARVRARQIAAAAVEDLRSWQESERERALGEEKRSHDAAVFEWLPKYAKEYVPQYGNDWPDGAAPTKGETVLRVLRVLGWMLGHNELSPRTP